MGRDLLRINVSGSMLRIRRINLKMGSMRKPRPNKASLPLDDRIFPVKQRKAIPYQFVLDALADLPTETRTMFGCLAVYLGDKIVFILRDRRDPPADNGVWLATTEEHHGSLAREFPSMRSIQLFGRGPLTTTRELRNSPRCWQLDSSVHSNQGRVPHISLVFREMWIPQMLTVSAR